MGMTVFSGMLIATFLAVALIPVLYVTVEKVIGRGTAKPPPPPAPAPAAPSRSGSMSLRPARAPRARGAAGPRGRDRRGCRVGPDYKRPDLQPPAAYRGAPATAGAETLADVPWWQVFDDEALQALLRDAIAHNLDLRLAVARVSEARALAGVAKSFLYPDVNLNAGLHRQPGVAGTRSRRARCRSGDRTFNNTSLDGRRWRGRSTCSAGCAANNEAAFNRYLATEEGRRAVLVTLVGDVASSYFLLRELDLQLEIARRTLELNDQTVVVLLATVSRAACRTASRSTRRGPTAR